MQNGSLQKRPWVRLATIIGGLAGGILLIVSLIAGYTTSIKDSVNYQRDIVENRANMTSLRAKDAQLVSQVEILTQQVDIIQTKMSNNYGSLVQLFTYHRAVSSALKTMLTASDFWRMYASINARIEYLERK